MMRKTQVCVLCYRFQVRYPSLIACLGLAIAMALVALSLLETSVEVHKYYGVIDNKAKSRVGFNNGGLIRKKPVIFVGGLQRDMRNRNSSREQSTHDKKALLVRRIGQLRKYFTLRPNSTNWMPIGKQLRYNSSLLRESSKDQLVMIQSLRTNILDDSIKDDAGSNKWKKNLTSVKAAARSRHVYRRVNFSQHHADSVVVVDDGIYWSSLVEDAIPTGISSDDADLWLSKVHSANVHSVQPASWDRCGRPLNAFVELQDGSHLCARYRVPRDRLVYGEVLSYWLSRYMGLDCVPPTALFRSDHMMGKSRDFHTLGWRPGNVVALIQWVDRSNSSPNVRVLMPKEILEAYRYGYPVSAGTLSRKWDKDTYQRSDDKISSVTSSKGATHEIDIRQTDSRYFHKNQILAPSPKSDTLYSSISNYTKPIKSNNSSSHNKDTDTEYRDHANTKLTMTEPPNAVNNSDKGSTSLNQRSSINMAHSTINISDSKLPSKSLNSQVSNSSDNNIHRKGIENDYTNHSDKNDSIHSNSSQMLDALASLAQWGTMIIFDYLTGNYDRVASMQDGAERENDPAILQETIRNLRPSDGGHKLWLIDNESGLLDAYTVLYFGESNTPKFVRFHEEMLRTMCVFQRKVVRALRNLHTQSKPHKVLMRFATERDKLFKEMEPDESYDLFTAHFSKRLGDVVTWIQHCKDTLTDR